MDKVKPYEVPEQEALERHLEALSSVLEHCMFGPELSRAVIIVESQGGRMLQVHTVNADTEEARAIVCAAAKHVATILPDRVLQ